MHLVLNELALISVRCSVPSGLFRALATASSTRQSYWSDDSSELRGAFHALGRALAGYQKALGPDHTSTLNTVNNLRNLYSDQGKLKKAEEMY
ncbi:hypothetical protein N7485_008672 [Penicillium canescens]|nr:hypothetical protein N7485_008672 [Penicillium canescens]